MIRLAMRWTARLLSAVAMVGASLLWVSVSAAQMQMPTGDPAEAWVGGTPTLDSSKVGNSSTKILNVDPKEADDAAKAGIELPGTAKETKVLFLHSHTPDDAYTMVQTRGFFDALKKRAPGPINSFREYLFLSLRGVDEEYHTNLVKLLQKRYQGVTFNLVMITDTRALRFYLDHLRQVMPGIPAVFSGSYEWHPALDEPDRNITGVMEKVDVTRTLDLIRSLRPSTRHVAVMSTETFFGRRMRAIFEEQLAGRDPAAPRVSHYTPRKWENILEPFEGPEADRPDAMIYLGGPYGLTPGKHLFPPQWIQREVPGGVPVFALFDGALGPDVIGGVVCSGRRMGEIAGEAACRILFDGVKPSDIPIDRGDGSIVPMFRWDVLKKWGIDEAALPPGYQIIGRPESWYARHERALAQAAAVIATLAAVVMSVVIWRLVVNRRRLAETQGRLELMASSLGEAFWIAEPDGWTFTYATEAWEKLWGRPRSMLTGHALEAMLGWVHPEDREEVREKCARRPGVAEQMENRFRVVHPDGGIVWIECRSRPMFDDAGKVTRYVGVQRDITERMASKQAVMESEKRLAEVIRTAPVAIIEWDSQWRCTRWDGLAEAMFGWTAEEVLGRSHDDIRFVHEDDLPAMRETVARHEADQTQVFRCTNRHYTKTGDVRVCEWIKSNRYDEAGRRVSTLSMVSDVTERETARGAMIESEERFRLAVAAVSDTIYDWDIVADVVRKSGNGGRLPASTVDRTHTVAEFISALHPDDLPRVKASLGRALEDGSASWESEYRHLLADGSWGEFHDRAVIVRDAGGKAVRMVGAMTDVSARRCAERALRESEQRYRLVARVATDIIWDWDVAADRIEWSDAAKDLAKSAQSGTGLTIGEWIDHLHPDDRERVRTGFYKALNDSAAETWRDEYRMVLEDGTIGLFMDQAHIARDDGGKAVRMIGAMTDVTRTRESAAKLAASESRLRAALTAAGLGTFDVDLQTGSMDHDDRAAELFGLQPGERIATFQGRKERLHPDDAAGVDQREAMALMGGQDYRCEARVRHADGSYRWILGQASIIRDETGRPIRAIGVLGDIHERKTSEDALRDSEQRLRLALEASGMGAWNADVATKAITHSERSAKICGIYPSLVEGSWEERIARVHLDDRERVTEIVRKSAETGNRYEATYRLLMPSGEYRWIAAQAVVVKDDDGVPRRAMGVMTDVTERMTAQEALRVSEERFRELADTVEHGFWVRSVRSGKYEYLSPAMGRMMGMPLDKLPRDIEGLREYVHPDDVGELRRRTDEWVAAGCQPPMMVEFRMVHPNGDVRWLRNRAYAGPRSHDGTVERVLGTSEDVTERIEAIRRIAESEAKFREIAENIRQVFWVADPGAAGRMRYVSSAVKDVFGLDQSEVEGTEGGWARLIHPDDLADADVRRVAWHDAGAHGKYENSYRIIRPDGQVRHIQNRGYSVRDESGRIVRVTGLAEDVTERETARLRLESSERRFREMAENINQVFWMRSMGGPEVQYVSPATERLWGVPPEKLLGSIDAWRKMIHPDDAGMVRARMEKWVAGGGEGQYESEFRILKPDGELRWVRSRAVSIVDESGSGRRTVGVTEDITERKTAEIRLESTLRTQRLLLSELDHRVKNNLAGLLALIEMSSARETTVPSFGAAMRRRVGAMVEVHAVLSSSKWEPVDLMHMLSVLSPADVPGRLRAAGPRVFVPPSKATPLGMVLQELLSNSQKYGALGTPGGEVDLKWTCHTDSDALWLTLQWNETGGPPISAPPQAGLGTSLIEGFSRYELRGGADLRYPRTGVTHTIRVDISTDSAKQAVNGHPEAKNAQGAASTPAVLSTSTTGV